MNKLEVRKLKSHFRLRWSLFRHNTRRQDQKILFLDDKFVIRNTIPGLVFVYRSLGEVYQDILPLGNESDLVNNIVIINPVEFLYATQDQILNHIKQACKNLVRPGRLILNVNLLTVTYDRLNVSRDTYCDILINRIESQGFCLNDQLRRFEDFTHGYGQLFLSFDYE